MREIKFNYLVKRHSGHIFSETFTLKEIESGKVEIWMKANHVYAGDVTRRQFTGLRDKNGVEIYEGDVVVGNFGHPRYFVRGAFEVVFLDGAFQFISIHDSSESWFWIDSVDGTIEVKGNRYERPELMEGDK